MTINLTMALVLAVLYSVGFYLLMQRSLVRILLGIVVLGHGSNLLLQTAGGPPAGAAMIGITDPAHMADPLPQAMALTAIVITFALTTFLLALAYRSWSLLGHDEVRDDLEDRRIRRLERRLAESEEDTAEEELEKEATQ
ncbi:Na(+)/H(+) antiporter subunit C [Saccharopolyspora hordei]|uniref:Multicomponent Na+:H+ antiporter subunit C n=1 Tax=Saccharopolyspora hordei TaxID=1838 RepID=A0A853AQA4_9PSEU|nr:Na(+)/H(+) antiporter subunit C [Saccharopolyspora hordei]NYI82761.1 multicomponent Na+:H+ antiporter subunit C [Saccharopolyspora hordei]